MATQLSARPRGVPTTRILRLMEISRASDRPFEQGDTGRFTGEVSLGSTVADDEGTNVGIVHFAAGARTR